jgi:hypothetical protein
MLHRLLRFTSIIYCEVLKEAEYAPLFRPTSYQLRLFRVPVTRRDGAASW